MAARHSWQDRPAGAWTARWRQRWQGWSYGGVAERLAFRARLLNISGANLRAVRIWATDDAGTVRVALVNKSTADARTISLRLPVAMIEDLKMLANKRDVPYQSLLKVFLCFETRDE